MTRQRKQLGSQAESLAADLLRQKGLEILGRNLRTRLGEIDILARDGRWLVIVEVKAKTSTRFGSALEMITAAKREQLILLARELQMNRQTEKVRIDVVAVDQMQAEPELSYHRGVVFCD